ncbi:MAG: 4'-phosphopantetheinyl transferase superfamily protein [Proteobacteria bacterium]|nr:4'-phosphopantetheinyl transferase superfamily protein [Pseudomonadota bacterium]MBU1389821.1 4'-phosphopantetheinyl transferase superfamily protein [Pseudomonadota bacterium]MBU1543830.1 4'-phosphopantetheinyl transferase superfamily protein [Pseudomonadota bacterium]MBU2430400.1 4'-phosphopantetheinyl transferase superfamily protein [Pseudomonadota bacterium]MBU2482363.1 4'-phosphopantetheinyl transferase superfamily protein [Pseudomonadota bacterium]
MLHVGNDIVDLCTKGTIGRSKDLRFVDRILTDIEKKHVLGCQKSPDTLLWAFWAAKETAYKAMNKSFPDISSAPRRYAVTLDNPSLKSRMFGCVKTPAGVVAISIFIQKTHVHCIGTTGNFTALSRVIFGAEKMDTKAQTQLCEQQSMQVRRFAKQKIAHCLNLDTCNMDILRSGHKKDPGPPVIRFNNQESFMDISLSHHGRYVAFAVQDVKKE